MFIRIVVAVIVAMAATSSHAFPIEAIGAFFSKLFKGGVAKESVMSGRSVESVTGAKGLEHLATGETAKSVSNHITEATPNLSAEIAAKNPFDADTYKRLRLSAAKGNPDSMLKMSDLTASGKVIDPGEPWRGYWMFQAARLGSQNASRQFSNICTTGDSRRNNDMWFDSACATIDGRRLFIGYVPSPAYAAPLHDLNMKSFVVPGAKP